MLAPEVHRPDSEARRGLGQTLWCQPPALLGNLGEPEAAVVRAGACSAWNRVQVSRAQSPFDSMWSPPRLLLLPLLFLPFSSSPAPAPPPPRKPSYLPREKAVTAHPPARVWGSSPWHHLVCLPLVLHGNWSFKVLVEKLGMIGVNLSHAVWLWASVSPAVKPKAWLPCLCLFLRKAHLGSSLDSERDRFTGNSEHLQFLPKVPFSP